jgi:Silicon transporter
MVNAVSGAQVLGLPPILNQIFLGSDLGVMLCTIIFGQLIAVINCSHNMLDYINNWCMVASTYVALTVEATGILHAVYLVQIIFTKLADRKNNLRSNHTNDKAKRRFLKKKQSDVMEIKESSHKTLKMGDGSSSTSDESSLEPADEAANTTKPTWKRVLFWARVFLSLAMSIFAVIVFMTALVQGNTTVRSAIPVAVSVVSLIILLLLGGFMEALQIALFAVKHLDPAEIEANPRARRNTQLILSAGDKEHENSKLQAFMVGRQIAQTVIMFMIARIVSVDMKVEGETMFGVPPTVQKIVFDSGLLNALVMTIFASLSWRVTANFFPMVYLGSPISIWIIRLCLLVEGTGICDSAWVFAKILSFVVGYKSDRHYIAVATSAKAAGAEKETMATDMEEGATSSTATKTNKSGYHKQSSITTASLDSSSSCGGSCHAADEKEQDEC